tara:strand:- start:1269 stop:1844 length:576 start_codon:yes stop_codon:yes gene_type:complete
MRYILASKSPRRSKILINAGYKIKIIPSNIDESKISETLNPEAYCVKLSKLKSKDIAMKYKNHTIIGADTIVYIKNKILNKPKNFNEAKKMLTNLSNNTHKVLTGVSIINIDLRINVSFYDTTKVTFYKLSENEINDYINKFKPYDKSGSYGIQDGSNIFIKKIVGSYENIMGFPISKFNQLIKKISSLQR